MKKLWVTLITGLCLLGSVGTIKAQEDGDPNTFTCGCVSDGAGGCIRYQYISDTCIEGEYTYNTNICDQDDFCGGNCTKACIPLSQTVNIQYGENCDPADPNHVCLSDPTDLTEEVTCRPDQADGNKCLKVREQTDDGSRCVDATECKISSDGNGTRLCATTPGDIRSRCINDWNDRGLVCQDSIINGLKTAVCVSENPPPPDSGPDLYCPSGEGIFITAIGCINAKNPDEFYKFWVKFGVGVAGGVGFVIIPISGIMLMFSRGNPYKTAAAKELLTSGIGGLLLALLSAYLLRLIGLDILQIPGF
jgi:hypothetical protein